MTAPTHPKPIAGKSLSKPTLTSLITWHRPEEEMPELSSVKILLTETGTVAEGFWDGAQWRWSGNACILYRRVIAWADMPDAPEGV